MRRVLLGMTGSVASILYKKLIAQLQTIGQVDVVLTPSACHFVNDLNLPKLLNGGKLYVDSDEWKWKTEGGMVTEWKKDYPILHIELRNKHDALVIAPCSANTLAKISCGICDNLLTSVAKAWDFNRPFIIAPSMNTYMMAHPTTGEHLLRFIKFSRNNSNIPTQPKMLACGTYGDGAMGNIDDVVNTTRNMLKWMFPLSVWNGYGYNTKNACSGIPIGKHPGAFGVQRKHSCHTGVDLYADEDTHVMSVEDGTVVCVEPFTGPKDNSPWWNDTDCVLIEGASGVICYGEIWTQHSKEAWVGQKVRRGNIIGGVKRVIRKGKEHPEFDGWKPSMLHMELYPHGYYKPSTGFEKDKGILIDPTPYLMEAFGAPKNFLLPPMEGI